MMNRNLIGWSLFSISFGFASMGQAADKISSHPPLRQVPAPQDRPLAGKNVFYVDARNGNDNYSGTREQPWKSAQFALAHLQPGDTLCLRGGVYYERLYVALAGTKDKPITIRSAPGEHVVIDGGLRELFDTPQDAWTPVDKPRASTTGAGDNETVEYRSVHSFPNLRHVIGSFGDSMIGLNTYYYHQDLMAKSELVNWSDWDKIAEIDSDPLYCGPGLWYDRQTGHIHARLSHTHVPDVANYRGETDPRKLPLVVAPFNSVPLHVDGGEHLRFQDLEIRGGGYTTVVLDHATGVELDNVTVWCGTYGIRAVRVEHLHLNHSRIYGSVPPWTSRQDASKRDYPGRPHRNITRLNTHALMELEAGRESSVYFSPQNDHWLIEHCHFADAHDGLYLGGMNVDFHHNLIENLQDDGLYLSPMYLRHGLDKSKPQIRIHENIFRHLLTGLAFGGQESDTSDEVYVYRNLFDLRWPVFAGRPSTRKNETSLSYGKLIGDHGSPPWPTISFYHNTVISREPCRDVAMSALAGARPGHPRRVFNNVFWHMARLPGFVPPNPPEVAVCDGNLYWSPLADEKTAAALFERFRKSPQFEASKSVYPPGSTTHSRVAKPWGSENDVTLTAGSPAIDAGVPLPADWLDPLRDRDQGKPDIGALPLGVARNAIGPSGLNAPKN